MVEERPVEPPIEQQEGIVSPPEWAYEVPPTPAEVEIEAELARLREELGEEGLLESLMESWRHL